MGILDFLNLVPSRRTGRKDLNYEFDILQKFKDVTFGAVDFRLNIRADRLMKILSVISVGECYYARGVDWKYQEFPVYNMPLPLKSRNKK